MRYWITTDAADVVRTACPSAVAQPGAIEVEAAVYLEVVARLGRCRWVDGALADYAPPATESVVPAVISDRQFAQALALDGTVTEDEALAWAARGELPAAMETALAQIEVGQRFGARMLLSAATTYELTHPLVPVLGALLGYDADAIAGLWTRASTL